MDLCHLKNSELEPQYPKYKGRVVLRGDIVKDDFGSYAVFTEQGSPASQITVKKSHGHCIKSARMRRTSSRRSVRSQPKSKWENAPTFLSIPKSECPDMWIRLPKHKCPKSWSSMEDPVVRLERSLLSSSARAVMEKAIRESSIGTRLVKSSERSESQSLVGSFPKILTPSIL